MNIELEKDIKFIAIGSDHGGWELKEHLKDLLIKEGHVIKDFGISTPKSYDYPLIGIKLSKSVSEGKISRGILICGTGIGMSIVANKFPNIRAALCHDIYTARVSREHNDANILVLGGRILDRAIAEEILKVWLTTQFSSFEERHKRRLKEISKLEEELGLR